MATTAINLAIERQRHRGFVGRGALLAELDRLLVDEPADRWVVVTGGPGMGKSALLAAWPARREQAGDRVPHHFIRRGWADWDDPARLVGSLLAQIDARFPTCASRRRMRVCHPQCGWRRCSGASPSARWCYMARG